MSNYPFVTVIVPIRNEEKYLKECLTLILNSDYPEDHLEIIVIDGMSTDTSPEIVENLQKNYPNLKMSPNPKKIVPTALNIGIKQAKGDIIIRVDGHTIINKDYIKKGVECLLKSGADCVGGLMQAKGTSPLSESIALAMSCPFGTGNSKFHYSSTKQYVDTVYSQIYPRSVFEKIGFFDEELVRDQDDEFNYRLCKQGGKILLFPQLISYYHVRTSLGKLWKQFFQYGFWKVKVFQKLPTMIKARHLIPGIFVLTLITFPLLGIVNHWFLLLFYITIVTYLSCGVFFSIKIAIKRRVKTIFTLPLIFGVLHISYGLGFLCGFFRFSNKWFKKNHAETVV